MAAKEAGNQDKNTRGLRMAFDQDLDETRIDDETDPFYQAVAVAIDEVEKPSPKGGGKTGRAHEEEIRRRLDEAFGLFDSAEF